MTLSERIGLDLGTAAEAGARASAAAAAGAGIARVRFPLGDRAQPDEAFLHTAQSAVAALRRAGLQVLAVVDGSLTVAPEGMGAFAEHPPEALARAWREELTANAGVLAEAIGEQVYAWEVLVAPNVGSPPRIAAVRWAELLADVVLTIRAATAQATIVSGGLVSNESDDGVDYLRQVYRTAEEAGLWSPAAPPFDRLGLRLNLYPDGGHSEEAVGAALIERTHRLWRVLEQIEGTDSATRRGVFVTGLLWDAARTGEEVQARNVWTAFNTLSADPIVHGIIWTGLTDGPTLASGLYGGTGLEAESRRPAWQAFNDFALYARQISPAPSTEALLETPPEPAVVPPDSMETLAMAEPSTPVPTGLTVEGQDTAPLSGAPPAAEQAPIMAAQPDAVLTGETVTFRIPGAAEVLQGQGVTGERLKLALEAAAAKYGDLQWLPPGEYSVAVPPVGSEAPAPARYTNQQMISAFYRAGGGTWTLFERSGLVLSELAAQRDEPYRGPRIESLENLTADEREAVRRELGMP